MLGEIEIGAAQTVERRHQFRLAVIPGFGQRVGEQLEAAPRHIGD